MNPSAASGSPAESTAECFPKLQPLIEYLDSLGGRADLETLRTQLENLDLTFDDLGKACCFDEDDYRRNLIKKTEFYEMVCICWKSGQRTPIHDHKGASCAFKVLHGTATETIFERSPSGLVFPTETNHQGPGYVCASAEADIHQVANCQADGEILINLHIYSPMLREFNIYSLDTRCVHDPATVRPAKAVLERLQ